MSVNEEKPAGDQWKKWGLGLLCLAAVVVSAFSIIRQIPPPSPSIDRSKYPNGGGAPAAGGGAPAGRGGPGGQQMPGTRGQITTVSATAITIQGRDGVPKTFAVTAATKIMVDQKPAAAADLKAGQRARVVSKDEKSADEINIRTGPPRRRSGWPRRWRTRRRWSWWRGTRRRQVLSALSGWGERAECPRRCWHDSCKGVWYDNHIALPAARRVRPFA